MSEFRGERRESAVWIFLSLMVLAGNSEAAGPKAWRGVVRYSFVPGAKAIYAVDFLSVGINERGVVTKEFVAFLESVQCLGQEEKAFRLKVTLSGVLHSYANEKPASALPDGVSVHLSLGPWGQQRRIHEGTLAPRLTGAQKRFFVAIAKTAIWAPFMFELPKQPVILYEPWVIRATDKPWWRGEYGRDYVLCQLIRVDEGAKAFTVYASARGMSGLLGPLYSSGAETQGYQNIDTLSVRAVIRNGRVDSVDYLRTRTNRGMTPQGVRRNHTGYTKITVRRRPKPPSAHKP